MNTHGPPPDPRSSRPREPNDGAESSSVAGDAPDVVDRTGRRVGGWTTNTSGGGRAG